MPENQSGVAPELQRSTASGCGDASRVCHTCLFYGDPALGARVVPVLENAVRDHRRVHAFQLYLWPCDVLSRPAMAERASACAEVADVVAVALDGKDGLEPDLLRWLDLWEQHRAGQPNRLMALFHPRPPDRAPLAAAFRDLSAYVARTGIGLIWCSVPADFPPSAPNLREAMVM